MEPPPLPTFRPTTEWLPPRAFLPPETQPPGPPGWLPWHTSQGTPYQPRSTGHDTAYPASWDARRTADDYAARLAADRVYDSIDELALAMQAQLAALAGSPEFLPWRRNNPEFKPLLSGFIATAQGPRRITVLLDTGATHCFICARLAAALGLRPSGQPGPVSVLTAATGGAQVLAAPVRIHLGLGDAFREALSVSPMDMDVGADLILGWDWISSHDLRHLFQGGQGGSALRAGEAAAGAPPGGSTPASRHALHCNRTRRAAPPPSSNRPRRYTGKHCGRSSSVARVGAGQCTVEGLVTPDARGSC